MLDRLTNNDLVSILADIEETPLEQQRRLVTQHGIELKFSRRALERIAHHAIAAQTNARGAESMLLSSLRPLEWKLPELEARSVRRISFVESADANAAEFEVGPPSLPLDSKSSRLRMDAATMLALDGRKFASEQKSAAMMAPKD